MTRLEITAVVVTVLGFSSITVLATVLIFTNDGDRESPIPRPEPPPGAEICLFAKDLDIGLFRWEPCRRYP